jgi:ABC-2 type transport system permease protein
MDLWMLIKKEVKELITPGAVLSVIVMAMIFGMMGNMVGDIRDEISIKPKVGYIDRDEGNLSDIAISVLHNYTKVVYNGTDSEEGLEKVESEGAAALLIFYSNFTENIYNNKSGWIEVHWMMYGAGLGDTVSTNIVEWVIRLIDYNISISLLENHSDLDPSIALSPTENNETTLIKGIETRGIDPDALSAILSSQSIMVPIIMMMVIMMTGGMVLSSMGMEKENKTLETLLTLPIKRGTIVTGKLIGCAIVGILMAGIYMLGFVYYMNSLTTTTGLNLEEFGLTMEFHDYILFGLSLFTAILAGLALCMLLGTFVKNMKSAQTLTLPVAALAMIPMFIIMFRDYDTSPMFIKVLLFIIPFSHPMMAGRALIFGDYLFVISGIIYSSVFALIMVSIAVWIFNSDRLLVGRIKTKEKGGIRGLFRK